MGVAEVAAAAVGVDGLVGIVGVAALDGVLPGLAAGHVADLLGHGQVAGQEEVVDHEEVDLVGLDAGELVDLLGAGDGAVVLVVGGGALVGGGAGAEDLDDLVVEAAGDGHLGRHHDDGCGAVALDLKAGHAQVLGDLGVAEAFEVGVGVGQVVLGGELLERLLGEAQRVGDGLAAQDLGDAVEGVVDLLGGQAVLPAVLVDPVVEGDAKGGVKGTAVGAVVDHRDGREHLVEGEVAAVAARGVDHGQGGCEVHGAGQHDVVGAGGDGLDGLLQGHVAGAAGLGVVHGADAADAEPVGDLHVGGQGVADQIGVGGAVVEVLDVAGLEAGVLDGLQGGVAKGATLVHALGLGVILKIGERGATHAHDGHAARLLAELDHVQLLRLVVWEPLTVRILREGPHGVVHTHKAGCAMPWDTRMYFCIIPQVNGTKFFNKTFVKTHRSRTASDRSRDIPHQCGHAAHVRLCDVCLCDVCLCDVCLVRAT